jgi:hypothetical protein
MTPSVRLHAGPVFACGIASQRTGVCVGRLCVPSPQDGLLRNGLHSTLLEFSSRAVSVIFRRLGGLSLAAGHVRGVWAARSVGK